MQLKTPRHVAIIMDGNGRWAGERGLPRAAGHRRGVGAVRRVVEHAAARGVPQLTLFAFSSDNWQRPPTESSVLMGLFEQYLRQELRTCLDNDIVLNVVGRRDRLGVSLRQAIARAERATAHGRGMLLRLAVDYSARWSLATAAQRRSECSRTPGAHPTRGTVVGVSGTAPAHADLPSSGDSVEHLRARLAPLMHAARPVPDVDLLIRSGGERRLSDFLLLECAYAEIHFTDVLWPDFDAQHLDLALTSYARRERRFGALGAHGTAAAKAAR
jgi:undecaprenyl diphosphate synthase